MHTWILPENNIFYYCNITYEIVNYKQVFGIFCLLTNCVDFSIIPVNKLKSEWKVEIGLEAM